MKLYSLSSANRLVPILRDRLSVIRPAYYELRTIWQRAAIRYNLSVDDPQLQEQCLSDEHTKNLVVTVESGLELFRELGIACKSIEHGLLDFPCLYEDRIVYLCWQTDEESISHWHELDCGYSSRKLLLEIPPPDLSIVDRLPN